MDDGFESLNKPIYHQSSSHALFRFVFHEKFWNNNFGKGLQLSIRHQSICPFDIVGAREDIKEEKTKEHMSTPKEMDYIDYFSPYYYRCYYYYYDDNYHIEYLRDSITGC